MEEQRPLPTINLVVNLVFSVSTRLLNHSVKKENCVCVCVCSGLTSVEAGLHKHPDGSHTQLKVVRGDVRGVAHDERQRLHAFDERLGVVLAQVLTQGQAVLVDQRMVELGFGAERGRLAELQVVLSNLEETKGRGESSGSLFIPSTFL